MEFLIQIEHGLDKGNHFVCFVLEVRKVVTPLDRFRYSFSL